MQDHFSDDKFIEAAKVYKSIQAPSELREKILMGAEEKTAVEVMPRRKHVTLRQVSKALSMAACLAIMVAAMPNWIGDSSGDLGVNEIVIHEESNAGQSEEVEKTDFEEKVAESSDDARNESAASDVNYANAANEANASNTANASNGSVQKSVFSSRVSENAEPSGDEGKAQGERNRVSSYSVERASENDDEHAKGDDENTISLDSVLPSGVAKNSPLRQMKVRVIETTDEAYRMEITTAGNESAEISVSRNVENGHWEINSAAEE